MRIELRKKNGETKLVEAGEEYADDWEVVGVHREDIRIFHQEDNDAARLLADIEGELKVNDGVAIGDWVKFFAKPVAALLGKQDCMSCDVRRVILNAAKVVIARHGKTDGRRLLIGLLRKSFTEPEAEVLAELRTLLEDGK